MNRPYVHSNLSPNMRWVIKEIHVSVSPPSHLILLGCAEVMLTKCMFLDSKLHRFSRCCGEKHYELHSEA